MASKTLSAYTSFMLSHFILAVIVLGTYLSYDPVSAEAVPDTHSGVTKMTIEKALPLPPENLKGKIAYTQESGLWVIDPDTRQKQLVSSDEAIIYPGEIAFSPHCTSIAFVSNVPTSGWDTSGADIFVMRWDGTQRRRLTKNSPDRVETLRWSPDGKRIVYVLGTHYSMGGPPKYSQEMRVVEADGLHDHALVGTTQGSGPATFNPFWSRDSKRVLFTFYPGALDYEDLGGPKRETRVITLDGLNNQLFKGDWGNFDAPFVSRDGKWMAEFDLSVGSTGRLDLYQLPEKSRFRTLWFGGNGNLTLNTPIFGPNSEQIVTMGGRAGLILDAQGYARIDQTLKAGIWLLNRDSDIPVRLLVENAHLIGWL